MVSIFRDVRSTELFQTPIRMKVCRELAQQNVASKFRMYGMWLMGRFLFTLSHSKEARTLIILFSSWSVLRLQCSTEQNENRRDSIIASPLLEDVRRVGGATAQLTAMTINEVTSGK